MAKKLISVLLAAIMLTSAVCLAANTGDVAGNYYYVDVKTYMRNQLIDAYNVGNKTVIPAESLSSYGFSVVWNASSRVLAITDNDGTAVSNAKGLPTGKQGAIAGQYYYTDIVTTFNGTKIESYNIGGQTVIPAAVLRNFGFEVVWDAATRRVLIDTDADAVPSNAATTTTTPSLDAYKLKESQTYRSSLKMITKSVSMNGYQMLTSHDCYIISPLENKYYVPFKAFMDAIGASYVWDYTSSTMTVTVPIDDLINPKNDGFKNSTEPAGTMQYELKDIVFNILRDGKTYSVDAVLYGNEVFVDSSSLADALGMYCFNNTEFFTATMAYYIFTQGYTE